MSPIMTELYLGLVIALVQLCPVQTSLELDQVEDYQYLEHKRNFLKNFFISSANTSFSLRLQYAMDNVYFIDYNNLSQLCSRHMRNISAGLRQGEAWAYFFLDSNGHQPGDVMNGHDRYLGSYKQCKAIRLASSGDDVIEGSYWNFRIVAFIYPNKTFLSFLTWHACFPSSCTQTDAKIIADTFAKVNNFEGMTAYFNVLTNPFDDQWFWAAVVILSIFATISALGTTIDCLVIIMKKKTSEDVQPADQYCTDENSRLVSVERKCLTKDRGVLLSVLLCFSLRVNLVHVLKSGSEGDIRCLHGLRAVSMFWVILGHCTVFLPEINNAHEVANKSAMAVVRLFYSATFAVETFFLLSGCLVTYIFLRTINKLGGLQPRHVVQYYTHRYIRLTPLLAATMVIYIGIAPYTVDGPMCKEVSRDSDNCKKSWWKNLIYINNFENFFDTCMTWTWYVANDMQLYIVAPLVIVPLALGYRKIGHLIASLMLVCHLAANLFILEFYHDWNKEKTIKYLNRIYSKPWARVGPYAIGLVLGHLLFYFNTDLKLRKILYIPGWLLVTSVALVLVFVQGVKFKDHHSLIPSLTDRDKNIYEVIKAPLWSVCVGWIILACHYGYGGFINSILSWGAWVPLSRLTYAVYLCHLAVISFLNDIILQEATFDGMFLIQRWITVTFISYVIGLVMTLLFESPIRNLMSLRKTSSTGEKDGSDPSVTPGPQGVKE